MAALDIDQFTASFQKLFQDIAEAIPNITQKSALTSVALLKLRIREQGLNAEETAFPPYSEKYKKRKEAAGVYTGKTNLSFTNRMLNNLQVVETGRDQLGYFADVSAKNEEEQAKLQHNEDRYGNILGLTAKEQQALAADYDQELQEIIDKAGFGA